MLEYATAFSGLNLQTVLDKISANPEILIGSAAALLVIFFLTTRRRR